jgi:hypothetical protein
MDSLQLNELANKIRVAGGKAPQPAHPAVRAAVGGVHYKPALGNVHMAYEGGHINLEEAQDLNPKYDPSKKKQNTINAIQQRNMDNNPIAEKTKRREYHAKKKGRR